MDEPFGALDPVTRGALQQEMTRIHRLQGRTIVLVTHDIDEALRLAEHLVLMDHGEVVQQGNPLAMLTHPANDFVRQFLGIVNWVSACFRYVAWRITCVAKNGQKVRRWQKR